MLLCDGGRRCQDDLGKKRERSGGMKISQELMNALFSKTFQIYEHSPFRCECRGQERRIHSSEPNHVFKYIFHQWHPYCLRVALCLHLESPLSRSPPHSMACLRSDGTTGLGLAS